MIRSALARPRQRLEKSPGAYVVDQRGGFECGRSDVVSLEILERSLFGAAPGGAAAPEKGAVA